MGIRVAMCEAVILLFPGNSEVNDVLNSGRLISLLSRFDCTNVLGGDLKLAL